MWDLIIIDGKEFHNLKGIENISETKMEKKDESNIPKKTSDETAHQGIIKKGC